MLTIIITVISLVSWYHGRIITYNIGYIDRTQYVVAVWSIGYIARTQFVVVVWSHTA